jgi:predicted AAA+ superfamily ATPase
MISKDIIEKHSARSLNTTNKGYSISDYDFYFQIAKDNKVYFIDKPLTHYRRHKTNLSGSNPKVMEELSHLMEVYYKQGLITKTTYYKKISHNNIVQSLIYIES